MKSDFNIKIITCFLLLIVLASCKEDERTESLEQQQDPKEKEQIVFLDNKLSLLPLQPLLRREGRVHFLVSTLCVDIRSDAGGESLTKQ